MLWAPRWQYSALLCCLLEAPRPNYRCVHCRLCRVVCCGHSLGAALATLGAFWWAKKFPEVMLGLATPYRVSLKSQTLNPCLPAAPQCGWLLLVTDLYLEPQLRGPAAGITLMLNNAVHAVDFLQQAAYVEHASQGSLPGAGSRLSQAASSSKVCLFTHAQQHQQLQGRVPCKLSYVGMHVPLLLLQQVEVFCYAFASPRVGNQEFCNDFLERGDSVAEGQVDKAFRFTHKGDLVPAVPPPWLFG